MFVEKTHASTDARKDGANMTKEGKNKYNKESKRKSTRYE
jgi:hypothetical protein